MMEPRITAAHLQLDSPTPGGSAYSRVSPEVHLAACRRLSWLALIYSAVYFFAEGYYLVLETVSHPGTHGLSTHIPALIPIGLGVLVAVISRRGLVPSSSFGNVVVAIQLLGAVGIQRNFWGWETEAAQWVNHLIATGGAAPTSFLARLAAARIPIITANGLPWVAVWIMIVPLLLPLSTARTVVGSLLGAAVVPVEMGASLLAHGGRPEFTWLAWRFVWDATFPTFLCAGIAIAGSRVIYRLTWQLSDARQMGSYRLIERLGAGGMGEVWKAKHRLLARPAAIKVIRSESLGVTDPEAGRTALARFEREAQATALLASPHTVEIYDFGVTDDGSFYYVMELLDGLDLRTLVQRYGPVPANRAVHLLVQACHSLGDAHASGLIHRDVKPANIFACRRGRDYDFVKVLDFGLVKEAGLSSPADIQLTAEGTTTGTPAFMAPEAVHWPDRIDGRADLYSLGCVGYWLVTGKLVFERGTPLQTLAAHLNEEPTPPSSRSPQLLPESFERALMDCLQKDPAKRPPTADALAERLAGSLDGTSPWSPESARAWWESGRGAAAPRDSGEHATEPARAPR